MKNNTNWKYTYNVEQDKYYKIFPVKLTEGQIMYEEIPISHVTYMFNIFTGRATNRNTQIIKF